VHLEGELVRQVPQKLTVRRTRRKMKLQSDLGQPERSGPNNAVNRRGEVGPC